MDKREEICAFCGGESLEDPCPYCYMQKDLNAKVSIPKAAIPNIVGANSLNQVRKACREHRIPMHRDDTNSDNLCIQNSDLLTLRQNFDGVTIVDARSGSGAQNNIHSKSPLKKKYQKTTFFKGTNSPTGKLNRQDTDYQKHSRLPERGRYIRKFDEKDANSGGYGVNIFISYRRDDTLGISGRIFDRLAGDFGNRSVFIDIDSIPLGVNFKKHINEKVQSCDIFVPLIGSNWLGASGERRRIDDPSDFVRLEVEAALKKGMLIIPIIIGDASIPNADVLPESLKNLSYINGLSLDPGRDFHMHMDKLEADIRRRFESA